MTRSRYSIQSAPTNTLPATRRRRRDIRRQRSELMGSIKSVDTTPELAVRRTVHKLGFRFRLHRTDLPGKPDLVFPGLRAAIFVNGCFWHQHVKCGSRRTPKTRLSYWVPKLQRNVERDQRNLVALRNAGWAVLTVWECEIKRALNAVERKLHGWLLRQRRRPSV